MRYPRDGRLRSMFRQGLSEADIGVAGLHGGIKCINDVLPAGVGGWLNDHGIVRLVGTPATVLGVVLDAIEQRSQLAEAFSILPILLGKKSTLGNCLIFFKRLKLNSPSFEK